MAMLCAVVGGLSAFYHDDLDIDKKDHRMQAAIRLIAKCQPSQQCATNMELDNLLFIHKTKCLWLKTFVNMLFGTPCEETEVSPVIAKAMDTLFLLHADHEQNASTSTVRLAGSTGSNPYACLASGIAALWGPAHGGANEAVLDMLNEIGDESRIDEYILKAKDKDDPFRLMGLATGFIKL